jgi:hypothetical protein
MTTATQQGAPANAPVKTKAFPDPDLPKALDNGEENGDDTPKYVNPRDAMLAEMDAKLDETRREEIRANNAEMAEAVGMPLEDYERQFEQGHVVQDDDEEGVDETPPADPLADYIVLSDGVPMFKTKVDGQEKLIPIENARAQLQKHVAAEIRLQQAATEKRALEQREAAIAEGEARLAAKLKQLQEAPPSVKPDVSDQDLSDQAHQVVSSLFTGSEDEAVKSLTDLLGKIRQAPGPQVDTQETVAQAVAAAKRELAAESAAKERERQQKDINSGFKKFSEDYPEIVENADLFRYADGLTDAIQSENPDWSPSAVMTEAGKRTRAWVESLKAPADPAPNNDRQNRKRNLTPMPQARMGTQERDPGEPPETPQSMIDEIRAARGQA